MTDFDTVREAVAYAVDARGDFTDALAALDRMVALVESLWTVEHNLNAENERLRKALDRIADGFYDPTPPWAMARQMMELARTALEEER